MVLKAKNKTPAPPRAEAKAKALKAKKAVLNGVHNHKNACHPPSQGPDTAAPKYPQKSAPRKNKHGHYAITKFP